MPKVMVNLMVSRGQSLSITASAIDIAQESRNRAANIKITRKSYHIN